MPPIPSCTAAEGGGGALETDHYANDTTKQQKPARIKVTLTDARAPLLTVSKKSTLLLDCTGKMCIKSE